MGSIESDVEMFVKDLAIDELLVELGTLSASLSLISGLGFESFDSMKEEIKHNYLEGLSRSVERCVNLVVDASEVPVAYSVSRPPIT
jgi:hypothetical protein